MKNKSILYILVILLLALPSLATIQSINYPAPNEIITETARIRLNVTSTPSSEVCWFTYNNVARNQTISCDGISLVDLPAASGTYNITVWDNATSSKTQNVTVIQNNSNIVLFIYILATISILAILFLTIYLLGRTATFETNIYDVSYSFVAYFALLISYQMSLEYSRVNFLLSWQELFINSSGWMMIVFSTASFIVCLIIRTTQKKNPKDKGSRY